MYILLLMYIFQMQVFLDSLDASNPAALMVDGFRPKGLSHDEVISVALATPNISCQVCQQHNSQSILSQRLNINWT